MHENFQEDPENPSWDMFVQNPVRVEARQVTGETEWVEIGNKQLPVAPGDWVVRLPSGIKKRYRNEQFQGLFSYIGTVNKESSERPDDLGPPGVSL